MPISPTSAAKHLIDRVVEHRYHRAHADEAGRALKVVEARGGPVPACDVRQADEYATEVLGHPHFAPWLYVYSAISGGFREGWIPDNFYGSTVVPHLKGRYGKIASLKPLNEAFFASEAFPDLASFVNGLFLDRQYCPIAPDALKEWIFGDRECVVFKLDRSLQGRGIHFLTRDDFSVETIKALGNGLFQACIRQHPLFDEFAPDAVATLRITTVFQDDGEVSVRACYLRLGTGSDTHVKSKSQVRIAIDLASGAFAGKGYLPSWLDTALHPTSGTPFSGHVVPMFPRCISTVVDLHRRVPYVRCIGWDVAVDADEGVKVMEWNAEHNDIKFGEATQGPCFADLGWEKLAARRMSLFQG